MGKPELQPRLPQYRIPEYQPKTSADFSKDTGTKIGTARHWIWRLRKQDPSIEAEHIDTGTGKNKTLSFIGDNYQKLLHAYEQRKNKNRETPKPQEFLTLPNGDKIPLLKGEKREEACRLFAQARDTGQPLSIQKLTINLYRQDDPKRASLRLSSLLHKMNKELKPDGWMIRHPEYIDRYDKTRKMRGFYEILKKGESPTTRESIIRPIEQIPLIDESLTLSSNPSQDKVAKKSQPPIIPLPIPQHGGEKLGPQTIWESPREKERLEKELNLRRKECIQGFTLSALSHINVGTMGEFVKDFKRNPTQSLRYYTPGNVSFDYFLGIDPHENKETKKRRAIEFFINGFIETINRLWNQQSSLVPIEKKILEISKELEQKGIHKNKVLKTVYESFGVKIPDEPETLIA